MSSPVSFIGAWANGASLPTRQTLLRMARRWGWALAGAGAGACLTLGWCWEIYEAHGHWQHKVQALRQELLRAGGNQPGNVAASAPEAEALLDRLPAQRDAADLGLALQQGLSQRGLQVQALLPQALQATAPLASQAFALRMQGRFVDVAQAWSSLVDAGPVWTMERLSVTPGAQAGQLQWDGVWRVWLRPDAPSAQAWPASWTRNAQHAGVGMDPFAATPVMALQSGASGPLSAEIPFDPQQWPLVQIRLLGVWQQGDHLQAVLGAGPHWAVLGPGARLAREAYRVQAVQADAVVLQAAAGRGPLHVLRFEGNGQ
jgi:hypothetical protein